MDQEVRRCLNCQCRLIEDHGVWFNTNPSDHGPEICWATVSHLPHIPVSTRPGMTPPEVRERLAHETELRDHYRRLADEQALASIEKMLADREWQPGRCTGCGLSDKLVKGPPGAQLCTYCDELRILPPLPRPVIRKRHPVRYASLMALAWVLVFTLPASWQVLAVAFFVLAFFLS